MTGSLRKDLAAIAAEAVVTASDALFFASLLSGAGANGPTMSDGVQLFNAAHGNFVTAASISASSIATATAAMRKQRSIDLAVLNLAPKFLLCGPDTEGLARQAIAALTPAASDAPAQDLVVGAHLTGPEFYLFTDPKLKAAIIGYLDREPGQRMDARTGYVFDG